MANAMKNFLLRNRLTAEAFDMMQELAAFRADMTRGLKGEKSTMFMIPTFLSPFTGTLEDQTVIVLDAGGTNLRVGSVTFRDGRADTVEFEKFPLPGTDRELTKDEFFDAVAEKLAPYLDRSDKVGFCFSYVAHCMENRDARLEAFCKEVKVTGAEGAEICRELDKAIKRRGITGAYRYVQLNDTVATLMGGMAATDRQRYDAYMGCILGTGTNACYVEARENIRKYTGTLYTDPAMIINMESGCYGGFVPGPVDAAIDAASAIPGDHPAEKMISGAYLGKILAAAMKKAAAEGLMTLTMPADTEEIPMPDVNAFLAGQPGVLDSYVPEDSRQAVRELGEGLYSRTARILAVFFGAVALATGKGRQKPICVVLEGSTYQKSPRLQELVLQELDALKESCGVGFEIVGAENATLIGSAFAAVGNA